MNQFFVVAIAEKVAALKTAQYFKEKAKGADVQRYFEVLGQIMNDLAARMVMDRTTLTRNLRPVLDAGLVTVRTGDDRRRREVALTRAGSRTLDEATGYWRAAQAEMRQALGDRRLVSLRDHLAETVSRVGELTAR